MKFTDAHRIPMQLRSFPMQPRAETARRYNDFVASVVAAYPDRFGMLANIPRRPGPRDGTPRDRPGPAS